MAPAVDSPVRRLDLRPIWFAVSAAAAVAARELGVRAAMASLGPRPLLYGLTLAWLALLILAGLAAWQLIRTGAYPWLLPLAALNLVLLEPGRAGDVGSWRLEWGLFGLIWTLVAAVLFLRLLARADELERRLHLEGASLGLAAGLLAAIGYALFEPRLPVLRAQWVAVALLLAWWVGFLVSAWRYRWRA
jgi:hypothetical protein